jgi:hypothetical protein
MFDHLVSDGQYREPPLHASGYCRRHKSACVALLLTMALGASARDQRHDLAECRVADLDPCLKRNTGKTAGP